MVNAPSWTLQYVLAALVALFAGPVLSKLPEAQSFPLTLFGLTGSQTLRLIVEGTGLVALCLLSLRAFRQMPDNGGGFSFLRQLVLPVTILFIVIVVDKTLHIEGLSLLDHVGPTHYALTYAAALTLVGCWITTAWLRHLKALRRFFANPAESTRYKELGLRAEGADEIDLERERS